MASLTASADVFVIIQRIYAMMAEEKPGALEISISFGYETKTDASENIDELLKRVEDKMYRRKLYESSRIRKSAIAS